MMKCLIACIVAANVAVALADEDDLKESYCQNLLDLKNGQHNEGKDGIGRFVKFDCDPGYVSNVPKLKYIKFDCKFIEEDGMYIIQARRASVRRSISKYEHLNLKDVLCEEKQTCKGVDVQDAKMNMVDTNRFQLSVKLLSKVQPRKFYSGDKLTVRCKQGYNQVLPDTEPESDEYYGYGSYENENEKPQLTTTLTCDSSGNWNNNDPLNLGTCKPITCDATRFKDMSRGNVTNYKDTFNYLEKMTLECEPGAEPINGQKSAYCIKSTDFEFIQLPKFGCEQIFCPRAPVPMFGDVSFNGEVLAGQTVEFFCNSGYQLIGKRNWTCLDTGKFDSDCVICSKEELYCRPPCMPLGAEIINEKAYINEGSEIEYTCKTGKNYSGSDKRICMRNRQWSGQPLDCMGWSLFNKTVGYQLNNAMKMIGTGNITVNDTSEDASGRTINVGDQNGVDVYIVQDVSNSISDESFAKSNEFIKALLPKLGINQESYGTRIAMFYFASKADLALNQHYGVRKQQLFKDYMEAQEFMDNMNLVAIRQQTDTGTDITNILDSVKTDIDTKRIRADNRFAQQVIIIISDGMYTQSGDPKVISDELKSDNYEVEIYSIFVGDVLKNNFGIENLQELSSKKENEQHFFKIDETSIDVILEAMIADSSGDIKCGSTYAFKTNIDKAIDVSKMEAVAEKNAWPWMAQFFKDKRTSCGGSVIGDKWILTAAHCFYGKKEKTCLTDVVLKSLHRTKSNQEDDVILYEITAPCADDDDSYKDEIFIHEKYDPMADPSHDYDIALVKLKRSLPFDQNLKPVCLWNDKLAEDTGVDYIKDILKAGGYGVATGWGKRCSRKNDNNCDPPEKMKQLQMKIQPECLIELDDDQKKSFNAETMFCAGEQVGNVIVDTCSGDSGGPFVVQHPTKPNTYIQIGIVSFGFGCKIKGKYGFYTKLTPELLTWIDQKKAQHGDDNNANNDNGN